VSPESGAVLIIGDLVSVTKTHEHANKSPVRISASARAARMPWALPTPGRDTHTEPRQWGSADYLWLTVTDSTVRVSARASVTRVPVHDPLTGRTHSDGQNPRGRDNL